LQTVLLHAGTGALDPAVVIPGWFLLGATLALSSRNADARADETPATPVAGRRGARPASPLVTGILLGIGIIGFLDEAIFHQILQWHTFYWDTDQHGRILSDGLFHVFSTLMLIAGTLRLWFGTLPNGRVLLAGILIGAGGFNAYDGIVQHAFLHLHLVNEHVCPMPQRGNSLATCHADIPFEIVWIGVGLLILVSGVVLWRRAARD
jgi:uncharacterized membrane protein